MFIVDKSINFLNLSFITSVTAYFENILDGVPLLPELFLLSATLLLLFYGIFKKTNKYNYALVSEFTSLSIIILLITSFLVWVSVGLSGRLLYENLLVLYFGSSFVKLFCLKVSILFLIMSSNSLNRIR
jgi:hypothetical protein